MSLVKAVLAASELDHPAFPVIKFLTALGGLLVAWRVWRFSIMPSLAPNEPKELPYWIPFLGHARAFFADAEALLTHGRQYFQNTRELFSLTIAGQKLYIVTLPKDMSSVYKNHQALSFNGFVKDLYTSFGMTPNGIEKMFQPYRSEDGPRAHLGTGIQKEQLHPGQNLEDLTTVYKYHIGRQMDGDNIPQSCVQQVTGDTKTVWLNRWCADVLGPATAQAFFGNMLLEIDPNLLHDFHIFDLSSWKLTYKLPRPFAKEMYAAVERMTKSFTQYYQVPQHKRNEMCHYFKTTESRQRRANMSDRDIAIAAQAMFWAANANHHKICFWLVSYLFYTPELLEAIRKEIGPAISSEGINVEYLIDQCPLLDASLNETLRLVTGATSARNVDVATVIGDRTLAPGAKLIMPYRQLHYEEQYFGSDVHAFKPSRFLDNKELHRSPYFKPFGGGMTYCSGRFIARREVVMLAAVILTQYDLEIANKEQGIPRLDMKKPTIGVIDPVQGDDLLLRVRRKVS